jgi:hypothetical protein
MVLSGDFASCGARKHHSGLPDYPAFHDAIGQAIACFE